MITPGQPMNRDQAFRLALVVERRARLDASTWVGRLPEQALLLARGRADQVIEPNQNTRDPLRAALAREWYVRVFEDQARQDLGQAKPELAVTAMETEHVAQCLTDGKAYRIHGPGGSLVLNAEASETVPGQAGFAGRDDDDRVLPKRPASWHREQLEQLAAEQDRRREQDERLVGAAWNDLTPEERTAFAAYLHQYRGTTGPAAYPWADASLNHDAQAAAAAAATPTVYTPTDTGQRTVLTGPPTRAAAEAFGHTEPSTPGEAHAARALAAKAFPKTDQKPPTIDLSGQTRTSVGLTADRTVREDDRSR